jgi:hypothetical protein
MALVLLRRQLPGKQVDVAVNPANVEWVQPSDEGMTDVRMLDGMNLYIVGPFNEVWRALNVS